MALFFSCKGRNAWNYTKMPRFDPYLAMRQLNNKEGLGKIKKVVRNFKLELAV